MDNSLPFVSVVLPVHNESAYIERGLYAILGQDYPADYMEIIIADGMSTDDTCLLIHDFSVLHPHLKIQILHNPRKIVPTGMNVALRQAKGEIILRVDGHCEIAPDYVSKCVEHILQDNVEGVGGAMETIGEGYLSESISIAMSSKFGVGNSSFRTEYGMTKLVDTVPFPAYTRDIINKAGLYDEELVRNQDDEYNYRIREAGGNILLAENVRSKYYSRGSLKKLWRQYYQYGFWKVRVLQKHPGQMSLRQFIPPAFVLSLLVSLFFTFLSATRPLASLIPLFYLLASLTASVWTASKRDWQYFPLLPITFAILHLSYGSGFLVGMFKFWNRWSDKVGKVPAF